MTWLQVSKTMMGIAYTPSNPWRLVFFETFATRSEALLREKQIKAKKSRKYIQYLVDNKRALYSTSG